MSQFFVTWACAWGFTRDVSNPEFDLTSESEAARIARVIEEQRGLYRIASMRGEGWATVAGKLQFSADQRGELPAVGDFVRLAEGDGDGLSTIVKVLPRRSRLARKEVGATTAEQVIAANVDTVLIMTSLNQDLNERRLERYLVMARAGGVDPVIVLTKADLIDSGSADRDAALADQAAALSRVALGALVIPLSVVSGLGMDVLRGQLAEGRTFAMVGSSGVGKSTLLNALLGEEAQSVSDVRSADAKGRHTTTARRLVRLPSGALLVDTPGMRELMPMDGADATEVAFADVTALGSRCRFSDCGHSVEPGCKIQAAIEDGSLPAARFASYQKMLREQAWLERRTDPEAASNAKKRWKQIHKQMRRHPKYRRPQDD